MRMGGEMEDKRKTPEQPPPVLHALGEEFRVGRCVKGRQNKDIVSFTLSIYSRPFLINEFHIDQLITII